MHIALDYIRFRWIIFEWACERACGGLHSVVCGMHLLLLFLQCARFRPPSARRPPAARPPPYQQPQLWTLRTAALHFEQLFRRVPALYGSIDLETWRPVGCAAFYCKTDVSRTRPPRLPSLSFLLPSSRFLSWLGGAWTGADIFLPLSPSFSLFLPSVLWVFSACPGYWPASRTQVS